MRNAFWKAIYLLLVTAIAVLCLSASPALSAQWTFMVYIGGDNNLSDAALTDLEEMRAATSHADVNVVVQAECSNNYSFNLPGYIPGYNTYRLLIANGNVQVIDGNLGNLDMGNPATLRDFIQWAAAAYPATRNALTIWDHGAGWKTPDAFIRLHRGAVEDETAGSFMSLAQLGQAVRDAGVRLHVLDFDACLMAMYEVVYEFIGLVDYLVFSEEVEPGNGNPYTPILTALAANPGMDARTLSAVIVDEFVRSYRGSRSSVTKSAVDMSQVPELHNRLLTLVQELRASLATQQPAIANARNQAQNYTFKANLDMGSLLDNLALIGGPVATLANDLSAFLRNTVVSAEDHFSTSFSQGGVLTGPNVDRSSGLAIFMPSVEILKQNEMQSYLALSCNAPNGSWGTFLKEFLDGTGGSGSAGSIQVVPGGFAFASLWLDQFGFFSDADIDLYVIEPDGSVGAPWIGESTSNGYFSPDSFVSGVPYEIYGSKSTVMNGMYLPVVNFYGNGFFYDYAVVYQLFMDPVHGVNFWNFTPGVNAFVMSLYTPAPEFWTPDVIQGIINGWYSDWWIPAPYNAVLRSMKATEQVDLLLKIKALADARRGKGNITSLQELYDYYQSQQEAQ